MSAILLSFLRDANVLFHGFRLQQAQRPLLGRSYRMTCDILKFQFSINEVLLLENQ